MEEKNNKKKHADFQDEYRKSLNFGKTEKNENLKVAGNGDVKLAKAEDGLNESDKQKIADAMDSFREKTEMTPGGIQSDKRMKNEEE